MIRKEFKDGGYPLTRKTPIICIGEDKDYIAGNVLELFEIISNHKILRCYGVWPGKLNTDFFEIDPQKYTELIPPKEYADVDSAKYIKIFMKNTKPVSILYIFRSKGVVSSDESLINYVMKKGLRYTVSGEKA